MGSSAGSDDHDAGSGSAVIDAPIDATLGACPNRMHWEADFSSDPRTLDVNNDGVKDWAIRNGDPTNALPGQLDNGVWRVPGDQTVLDTQPKINFDGVTHVHVRMRATTDDGLTDQWGSVVWLNVGYGDGRFAPLMISVTRGLGSQTARLMSKDPITGSVYMVLGKTLLGGGMLDIELTVDATNHAVVFTVNSSPMFSLFLDQPSTPNDDRWISLVGWDVETEFDLVEIENCP